ncbi:unnamed protein product, partial [Amoebophrya sp. A25]
LSTSSPATKKKKLMSESELVGSLMEKKRQEDAANVLDILQIAGIATTGTTGADPSSTSTGPQKNFAGGSSVVDRNNTTSSSSSATSDQHHHAAHDGTAAGGPAATSKSNIGTSALLGPAGVVGHTCSDEQHMVVPTGGVTVNYATAASSITAPTMSLVSKLTEEQKAHAKGKGSGKNVHQKTRNNHWASSWNYDENKIQHDHEAENTIQEHQHVCQQDAQEEEHSCGTNSNRGNKSGPRAHDAQERLLLDSTSSTSSSTPGAISSTNRVEVHRGQRILIVSPSEESNDINAMKRRRTDLRKRGRDDAARVKDKNGQQLRPGGEIRIMPAKKRRAAVLGAVEGVKNVVVEGEDDGGATTEQSSPSDEEMAPRPPEKLFQHFAAPRQKQAAAAKRAASSAITPSSAKNNGQFATASSAGLALVPAAGGSSFSASSGTSVKGNIDPTRPPALNNFYTNQNKDQVVEKFANSGNLPPLLQIAQLEKMAYLTHLLRVLLVDHPVALSSAEELQEAHPVLVHARAEMSCWRNKHLADICSYYPELFVSVSVPLLRKEDSASCTTVKVENEIVGSKIRLIGLSEKCRAAFRAAWENEDEHRNRSGCDMNKSTSDKDDKESERIKKRDQLQTNSSCTAATCSEDDVQLLVYGDIMNDEKPKTKNESTTSSGFGPQESTNVSIVDQSSPALSGAPPESKLTDLELFYRFEGPIRAKHVTSDGVQLLASLVDSAAARLLREADDRLSERLAGSLRRSVALEDSASLSSEDAASSTYEKQEVRTQSRVLKWAKANALSTGQGRGGNVGVAKCLHQVVERT